MSSSIIHGIESSVPRDMSMFIFVSFVESSSYQVSDSYATKLNHSRGDLIRLIVINESFLSDMMYLGVLQPDKKVDIQTVCLFFQDFLSTYLSIV